MKELCDLSVRGLEELIDYQGYPVTAALNSTINRRSLGVGYIGLAHYLAKNGVQYSDSESWKLVHDLTEAFQYYLLVSSNEIAKEKGACGFFSRTKYADGILPIDTYKKEVDEIVENKLNYDWESLRHLSWNTVSDTHTVRTNAFRDSSVVSNATNGIEPPRDYLSIKKSKKGLLNRLFHSILR